MTLRPAGSALAGWARCAAMAALVAAGAPARAETPRAPPDEPPAPPSSLGLAVLEGPVLTNVLMNVGGRVLKPDDDSYDSTWDTFVENLWGEWEFDPNTFQTNQFAHPYQGSLYMTASRSLGIGFYGSAALATLGAWLWETAGEKHPPSYNDLVTTSAAGALFGEALFRLSTVALGESDHPGFWREAGALAIAPMHGLNRLAFGNRYRDRRLLGIPWYGEAIVSFGLAGRAREDGASFESGAQDLTLAGRLVHGVPGADYRFRRPFDHFEATLSLTLNADALGDEAFGVILVRGLLAGASYGAGTSGGLWGLFAAYDYIAPEVFRASSSSLAVGTVGQLELGRGFALQGTASAGVGFGAAGVASQAEGERDYHFGLQAVTSLDLSLTWANRVRLRGAARVYLVGDEWSPDPDSSEDVEYGVADLVVRVRGPHAVALGYSGARRKARYPDVPDVEMSVNQLSISYRLVSDPGLGVGR